MSAYFEMLSKDVLIPLINAELNPWSEKESPIVILDKENWLPLDKFVDTLREGIIEGYMELESMCCKVDTCQGFDSE